MIDSTNQRRKASKNNMPKQSANSKMIVEYSMLDKH